MLTWFAVFADDLRLSEVTGSAGLAKRSGVTLLTLTLDDVAVVGDVARIGEIIGSEGQRTGADEAVAGCADGGVAMVTNLTLFAVVAHGVVLTVEALTGHRVASVAVVVTLARNAETAERTRLGAEVTRSAVLAGCSNVVRRAVALLYRYSHIGAG